MLEVEVTKKYLKPPTIEQIFSFVEEVGVKYSDFENFYGMHKGVLKNVKCGNKPLPRKDWWIFYERVVPKYGVYYNFSKPKKGKTIIVSEKVSTGKAHNRLTKLKDK